MELNRKASSVCVHFTWKAHVILALFLALMLCDGRLNAQVTGSISVNPVISGQTESFNLSLVSPDNVDGINGRLLYDFSVIENLSFTLAPGQPGFTLTQYDPSLGEVRFVLFKDPPDTPLDLSQAVLNLSFEVPGGLLGSSYATFEFVDEAAGRILTSPPNSVISVSAGGPGGTPSAKVVNFGFFAIPLIGRPIIAPNPTSQAINAGANAAFSISASGPSQPFTFQWYGPSGLIGSAIGPTLQLNAVTAAAAGSYRCDVTNVAGTSSSTSATLTVFDPPQTNSASFTSHTIPNPVYTGHSIYVGITFKNTSPLSWSNAQGYALAVTNDPSGLFGGTTRVYFNGSDVVVLPNASTSFLPYLTVPAAPGSYTASVRMVQEFVEFFGPTVELTVNVIEKPNATIDWGTYE